MIEENYKIKIGYILIAVGLVLGFAVVHSAYTLIFSFQESSFYFLLLEVSKNNVPAPNSFSLSLSALTAVALFSLALVFIALCVIIKSLFYSGSLIIANGPAFSKMVKEVTKISDYWSKNIK